MAAIVANCAISLNCELTQPVKVQYIDGNMFSMDNAGNTAHVYVFYNGEPQEIVGSVSADVIRSDGTTVAITGAMSGNRAYVIFPQSCYAVPGVVSVVIKVAEGSTVTTIAAFVANVYRSSTDAIVDPGTIIPSVQNLISAIETAVASIPADYSSLWESLAPDYTNITFPVTAGKYCTYNGTLYIAKVDIATTESFTAAHWQSTNIGDNLSALKGAIDLMEGAFDTETIDITPSASTSGKFVSAEGVPTDNSSCSYKTISVGGQLVGKTLSISGSSWINVRPYVFVGTSGTISFPSVKDSSPTQYTDLPFVPGETGTLYINIYASGSTVHVGKVTYEGITDMIAADAIPIEEIASEIKDAISFELVNLGNLITSKILNGNTGEIADGTNQIQRVTDYIAVTPDTAYLITTESNYARGLYAWYDENKAFISGAVAASGSTYTHLYGERVTSPKDAAYIVIGFIYQNPYPFPILMKGNMTSAIPSKRWTGKKWTIIGDSLSASYTVTGMHYHELIAGATGISRNNLSVSGTGYAKGGSNFRAQALSVPVDTDVVTIFGSGNDASAGLDLGSASDTGTETVAGCINATIDNLISVKPIMQVGIITPTPWHNNMPYDNNWMEQYSNLIVEICKRRSIPCLDLFHCTGLDTNNAGVISGAYSRDGGSATHLDEVGQNFITPRILHFMESLLVD